MVNNHSVNSYCILRQEPLQKTLCESILFIFSPYCRHIGYSYRLTARVILYAPYHRQDNNFVYIFSILPPHRLLLSINSKGYFICTISQTG